MPKRKKIVIKRTSGGTPKRVLPKKKKVQTYIPGVGYKEVTPKER